MVALPGAIPVTVPFDTSTVATLLLLLLHVPPATELLNDKFCPAHTDELPVIDAGVPVTFTLAVAFVPQPVVYVIMATPLRTLVTTPVTESIDATEVLLLRHEPRLDELCNVVVVTPSHIVVVPVIVPGATITSTSAMSLVML